MQDPELQVGVWILFHHNEGEFRMSSHLFLISLYFVFYKINNFFIYKNYLKHAKVFLSISLLLDPDPDSGAQTYCAGIQIRNNDLLD